MVEWNAKKYLIYNTDHLKKKYIIVHKCVFGMVCLGLLAGHHYLSGWMRFSKVWVVSFSSFAFCCDFVSLFVMRGLFSHFYPLQKQDKPFLFWYPLPIVKRCPAYFTGLNIFDLIACWTSYTSEYKYVS